MCNYVWFEVPSFLLLLFVLDDLLSPMDCEHELSENLRMALDWLATSFETLKLYLQQLILSL